MGHSPSGVLACAQIGDHPVLAVSDEAPKAGSLGQTKSAGKGWFKPIAGVDAAGPGGCAAGWARSWRSPRAEAPKRRETYVVDEISQLGAGGTIEAARLGRPMHTFQGEVAGLGASAFQAR